MLRVSRILAHSTVLIVRFIVIVPSSAPLDCCFGKIDGPQNSRPDHLEGMQTASSRCLLMEGSTKREFEVRLPLGFERCCRRPLLRERVDEPDACCAFVEAGTDWAR